MGYIHDVPIHSYNIVVHTYTRSIVSISLIQIRFGKKKKTG